MAINTQTITMRQGNKSDYQPSKMLSGELAVINDSEELHFSARTGQSIRVATERDVEELNNKIASGGGGGNPGGNGGSIVVDSYLSETSTNPVQNKVVAKKFGELSEQIDALSLGVHTDGLIYIFVNGKPVGSGLSISGGGTVEPEVSDNITLADGVMTIVALANEPTLTDGVLYVS